MVLPFEHIKEQLDESEIPTVYLSLISYGQESFYSQQSD